MNLTSPAECRKIRKNRIECILIIMFAHPFVKWAGGKSQLLDEIRAKYPSQIKKYCEPFVGGGAVLFDVLVRFQPKEVLINDINAELINTYKQVRDSCDDLIAQLSELQSRYKNQTLEENKAFFYEKRGRYNEIKLNENACHAELDSASHRNDILIEKAALFIFLNKNCFNGLYRVNAKGLFNVPFNSAKNPLLCDAENLRECSKLLQNVEMTVGDYSQCKDFTNNMGVPAKAVGCSALRYRSSSSLCCGGLLRRCSIA